MKIYKTLFLFIASLCNVNLVFSQKISYGVFAGTNTNFIRLKSDYEIQDGINLKNTYSYSGGLIAEIPISKVKFLSILESLDYTRIKNTYYSEITNSNGDYLASNKTGIINHMLIFNSIGKFNIIKGFYAGTGVAISLLLNSTVKIHAPFYSATPGSDGVYKNVNYRKTMFSFPLIIGYKINHFDVFARFNFGITNRLKSGSYVKELDNIVILGLGYQIFHP